jgi:peptidoglycan/LPS O-acetylase OafA/YrhL
MKRNQSLDVLRAVAVVLVIGHHSSYYPAWQKIGWAGVDLFFVLSGFLISGLLFQEYKVTGGIKIGRFLLRRGLKIWPSYYLLMIVAAVLLLFGAMSVSQLLSNLFFIQNYYPGYPYYVILEHTWTLAVEEHFYLLLPFLLVLLIALRKGANPFASIPLLSLCIGLGCLAFRTLTLPPHIAAWNTHMRVDDLFFGVALGYLRHFKLGWFEKLTANKVLPVAAMLIAPAMLLPYTSRAVQTLGLTSLALGFILLVAWAVVRTPQSKAVQYVVRAVARVGVYSYSIYLWHTVFINLFARFEPVTFVKFWLYVASCIAGGIIMAHFVEIPYLRMRDRLFPASMSEKPMHNDDAQNEALAKGLHEHKRATFLADV